MSSWLDKHIARISNRPKIGFWTIGLLFTISIFLHWNAFQKDLISIHAWRQTETQTVINNFYKEDFNILNPRINFRADGDGLLRKEFPLMQWIFAAVYKLFGDYIFISRFLSLLISLFSVIGFYKLLELLSKDQFIAAIGAWCLSFSPTFFYYSVCPMPDNFSLCLAIFGLFLFFKFTANKSFSTLILSIICFAIATLTKLPFVLFYSIPIYYFFVNRNEFKVKIGFAYFISAIPFVIWYIIAIPTWNSNGITTGIISNNMPINELMHYFVSNLISVLPELLLNYGNVALFLFGLYFIIKHSNKKRFYFQPLLFCLVLFSFYFLFELNMIKDMHDYYLLPFLPFLFLIVAYGAKQLLAMPNKWAKPLVVLSLLILPFTTFLRMQSRWNETTPGFNPDLYAFKNELRALNTNNDLVIVGNDVSQFIFLYYIDRKGWVFNEDQLDANSLKDMINKGAKFLYTDSKTIQTKEELKPYFETILFNKGSLVVFKLKP